MQRTLRSMKAAFSKVFYRNIYPSSSRPGLFVGLAKVYKVPYNSSDVTLLPLRPVIPNIGTATYQLSKYLADLLSPLTKSEYTVMNTNDFISRISDQ